MCEVLDAVKPKALRERLLKVRREGALRERPARLVSPGE